MDSNLKYDAVVVGSGPNGLSAAITLARKGVSVLVLEARNTIGGGARSEALTLPGFIHDVCSAVHPMGLASPFFKELPLEDHGLSFVHPDIPLAHPLSGGRAAILERSFQQTAQSFAKDRDAYLRIFSPFLPRVDDLFEDLIGPFRFPRYPFLALNFARFALQSAQGLAGRSFQTEEAKALWAGLAAHSILPLRTVSTSAIALVLGLVGHAYGWPFAKGGSQSIPDALASYLRSLGGEIRTGVTVSSMKDIPECRWVFLDMTPNKIVNIEGLELSGCVRKQLQNFRYGPGVFKIDFALKEAIPWTNKNCARAGTVHVGGTLSEITASEEAAYKGHLSDEPFVLVAQPSLFDSTRAPAGKHVAWAYCHVPNASEVDRSEVIEKQIEKYAPGFRDCILARHTKNAREMERYNANYFGGDITGGVTDLRQLFTRPLLRLNPYQLNKNVFICSASSPPGAGVHGLCGYYSASNVLK